MASDLITAGEALLGASPARIAALLTKQGVDGTYTARRNGHIEQHRIALAALFRRQQQAAAVRSAAGLAAFNPRDWDTRLADVVFGRNRTVAREFASLVARLLAGTVTLSRLDAFLRSNAELSAVNINDATAAGLEQTDDVGVFWQTTVTTTAAGYAQSMVTTAANFGARDGAEQAGAQSKTWQQNSGKPRSAHSALAGETVPIDATFSNGMRYPGDPAGGAENNAGCQCSLSYQ